MSLYGLRIARITNELRDRLPQVAGKVQAFEYVPLLLVRVEPDALPAILKMDGVLAAYPTSVAVARIVWGIDHLLEIARAHRETSRINGVEQALGLAPGTIPPYPVLDIEREPPLYLDPDIRLDTVLSAIGSVNLSVELDEPAEFEEDDPVNVATRTASVEMLPIIAAGNCLPGEGRTPLSPWARPEWVIGVGATADADGEALAPYSRIGSPGEPNTGPSVVAYGRDNERADEEGTSYAAPRVAMVVAQMMAFALTLRHFAGVADGRLEGIPLVGIGYIDLFFEEGSGNEHEGLVADLHPPEHPLPALPLAGVDPTALATTLHALEEAGISVNFWPSPTRLKAMLLASAQPVPGCAEHEVGRGFVGQQTTLNYLSQFSGADLACIFADGALPVDLSAKLSNVRIADFTLPTLLEIWRTSALKWGVDLARFVPP